MRRLPPGRDIEEALASAHEYAGEHGPRLIVREVSATFGALCLAGVPDDPLLWGHYADGHRGFALGFDTEHEWFQRASPPDSILNAILKVTYQAERPVVQMTDEIERAATGYGVYAKSMLFTKHQSWAYESEWRLVRELATASLVETTEDRATIHLFEFPPAALFEVVLGARVADNAVNEIVDILGRSDFSHVRLRRAHVSKSSYVLRIDDVERVGDTSRRIGGGTSDRVPDKTESKSVPWMGLCGLLILAGTIWLLQNVGVAPGSLMSGQARWAVYAAVAIGAGSAIAVLVRRRAPNKHLQGTQGRS